MKKRDENLIRLKELSELTGVYFTTVKYYADLGFIPYHAKENEIRTSRYFNKEKAVERVKLILKLRKKRLYIHEIKEYLEKLDAKEQDGNNEK